MEDVVADCQAISLAVQHGTPAPGAGRRAGRYLSQLSAAFALHQRLGDLARAGAKAGAGKGKKVRLGRER